MESQNNEVIAWYYMDGLGQYVMYPDVVTQILEDQHKILKEGQQIKPIEIEMVGRIYILDIQSLTQENKKTKVKRRILRLGESDAQAEDKKPVLLTDDKIQQMSFMKNMHWQFMSEKGWQDYGPQNQASLMRDYKIFVANPNNSTVYLSADGRQYTIDFEKMVQKNIRFNTQRKIQLVKNN